MSPETNLFPIIALGEDAIDAAAVARAYAYVIKNKKRWLESSGKQGINFVATNSSFAAIPGT